MAPNTTKQAKKPRQRSRKLLFTPPSGGEYKVGVRPLLYTRRVKTNNEFRTLTLSVARHPYPSTRSLATYSSILLFRAFMPLGFGVAGPERIISSRLWKQTRGLRSTDPLHDSCSRGLMMRVISAMMPIPCRSQDSGYTLPLPALIPQSIFQSNQVSS